MTLHSNLQHYSLVGKLEVMQVPVKSQTLHARSKSFVENYTVRQKKLHPYYFCNNFVKPHIFIIFGTQTI